MFCPMTYQVDCTLKKKKLKNYLLVQSYTFSDACLENILNFIVCIIRTSQQEVGFRCLAA